MLLLYLFTHAASLMLLSVSVPYKFTTTLMLHSFFVVVVVELVLKLYMRLCDLCFGFHIAAYLTNILQ